MTCEEVRLGLVNLLETGQEPESDVALASHLATCVACRQAWAELQGGFRAASALGRVETPEQLAATVRERIREELAAEAREAVVLRRFRLPPELVLSAILGGLAALASMWILGLRIDLGAQHPLRVALGGVLWTATFILTFWLALRRSEGEQPLKLIAICGLGALTAFMVIDHFVPLTQVVEFCQRDPRASRIIGPLGVRGLFFTLGIGYALVPLLLLSFATGRGFRGDSLRRGLVAGSIFFFLLAPSIYLQCSSFTLGVLGAWLTGSIVGSLAGSAAGYWIYQRTTARGI